MTRRPQLWVFAGPNGAGKSTLADRFVRGRIPIVNPDNIAQELPRTADGGLAELAAGRLALKERGARLRAGETSAFETTMSGGTELKAMRDATAAGYKVNLVYVGVGATYSTFLSAIAPLSGRIDTTAASLYTSIPVWAFVGSADTVVDPTESENIVANINWLGGNAQIKVYTGATHFDVPDLAYKDTTANLLTWLNSQQSK